MPWVKGQSGNPGGLSKGLRQVRDLARAETEACVNALVRIRDAKRSPAQAVVAAANALLDRGWGKPLQEHDLRHHVPAAATRDSDLAAIAFSGGGVVASSEADSEGFEGVVH